MSKPFVASFMVPVYESRVFVGCAKSGKELQKILPKKLGYEAAPTRGDVTNYNNGYFLLAIFQTDHNTIAHEVWHLTAAIMRYHDVRREEEAFAYLTGKLHEKVYRIMMKRGVQVES